MRTEGTAPIVRPPAVSEDGILFLYSPNLGIRVRYGSLAIDLGRDRTLTVERAREPRLRRLVIAGHGWWSFEVPRWLAGLNASWLQLDLAGRILGSGPGDISPDLPVLRRAQALSAGSEVARVIGVDLLTRKIQGQAAALSVLSGTGQVQTLLRDHVAVLADCSEIEELRAAEAQAAVVLWQALSGVPVRFISADDPRVPASWRTVGRRASAVTGRPAGASTAAHALWNFAYSCAAGEVGVALRSVGLDPGISPTGLHADTACRASATYDVLEAIRGDIDRLVLTTILGRRFHRRDFVAQPDGRVRLTAPLAREVAEAALPVAREAVAPIAERLARTLAAGVGGTSRVPHLATNLTGDGRSRGRDGIRRGSRKVPDVSVRMARNLLPAACRRCGVVFEDPAARHRQLCDDCLVEAQAEGVATMVASGPAAVARLRASGDDPAKRPESRRKVGEANTRRTVERKAWDADHKGTDPELFRQEILPAIQGLSLNRLAKATGLSKQYMGKVRRGIFVPHERHWEALAKLPFDGAEEGAGQGSPDQSPTPIGTGQPASPSGT